MPGSGSSTLTTELPQRSIAFVPVPAPAAQMVRTGDDPGLEALGDPERDDEPPDLRVHLDEVTGPHLQPRSVGVRHQERVLVRDLEKPLGVVVARVDQRGQPVGGHERQDLTASVRRPFDERGAVPARARRRPAGDGQSLGPTWLRMYSGSANSGHFQSRIVVE